MRYLLTILLTLGIWSGANAGYVPSGPRRSYNADVDSTRIASGGPLRNYLNGGTWMKVNSQFRLESGSLISDSGFHKVSVNLATNVLRLDWNGHIIKIRVAGLYAYRSSTDAKVKLADPNFTSRSFSQDTIYIDNVYPNVDLQIINTPDDIRHYYIFHQAARDAFGIWWANNGSFDDIYIVNAIEMNTDSLGLDWADDAGFVDGERELIGNIKFNRAAKKIFGIPNHRVFSDDTDTTMYRRITTIAGGSYLLEGFKWTAVSGWADGDISHYAQFGQTGTPGASYRVSGQAFNAQLYSPVSSGTLDSMSGYFVYKQTTTGSAYYDTIGFAIYTDNSGPDVLVDSSLIEVVANTTSIQHIQIAMTGASITASTNYWLTATLNTNDAPEATVRFYRNSGAAKTTMYYNSDVWPPPATFTGSNSLQEFPLYMYAVYTISGGEEVPSTRRRKIILGDK